MNEQVYPDRRFSRDPGILLSLQKSGSGTTIFYTIHI